MEKIILAIDGTNLNSQALDFACYLGTLTRASVTGVFLENLVANERPVLKETNGAAFIDWEVDKDSEAYKRKMATIDNNICLFKQQCDKRGVRFCIRRDEGYPEKDIIEETRYADVLIVDAETSFNKRFEGTPGDFVRDVLRESECPVIIAPETFDGINEIVFAYDASKSSVFAIKQFTYLFPQLEDLKVTVLHVNENGGVPGMEKKRFQEWISGHYSEIHFEELIGNPESELFAYLLPKKNVMVVTGAYGRRSLSLFFKHSHADLLIKTITQAIFIAHR